MRHWQARRAAAPSRQEKAKLATPFASTMDPCSAPAKVQRANWTEITDGICCGEMASQLWRRKGLDEALEDAGAPEGRLKRALGPIDLTALGIGAIIGAGIF